MSAGSLDTNPTSKPVLIPSAVTIAALNGAICAMTRLGREGDPYKFLLPVLIAIIVYVAVVLLRTRDVAHTSQPHPMDATLCRYSGVLLLLLTVLILAGIIGFGMLEDLHATWWNHVRPFTHIIVAFLTELGIMMAVAAFETPRGRQLSPAFLWKIISLPFIFLHSAVLIMLMFLLVSETAEIH
jgi:hypothetical protein